MQQNCAVHLAAELPLAEDELARREQPPLQPHRDIDKALVTCVGEERHLPQRLRVHMLDDLAGERGRRVREERALVVDERAVLHL